jgi:C_GCAxxG_C_C family probable redox protein
MRHLGLTKEEFMKKAYDMAYEREKLFCGCSQAIVSTFQDILGIKDCYALKMATPFAGGVARQGMICGALVGSIMVIGMKYGRSNLEDFEAVQRTYGPVQRLCKMFEEEFGSFLCRDITGLDLLDLEQMKYFFTSGRHDIEPPEHVGKVARMLAEVMYDREGELMSDISKVREG